MKQLLKILVDFGEEYLNKPYEMIEFTDNKEANILPNNLKEFPHAFVLACIMDRQIKTEKAWMIPYFFSKEIGGFDFSTLLDLNLTKIEKIFEKHKLHRFNKKMARNFLLGIKKIHEKYDDDASKIWKNNPKSATVIRRFLEFKGIGAKIANMATNILYRDFKIKMQDIMFIDISIDALVRRVMKRTGLVDKDSSDEELIYRAKELSPNYPGIIDRKMWLIGKYFCSSKNPNCTECPLTNFCPKNIA
ncbi:MAG: iron-sulfur cluster loop [Candidatus Heimdallarchaeaceae archaeon]